MRESIATYPIKRSVNGTRDGIQRGMINTIMNATLSIDRAGRLVLPKPVREQLQIEPGESLEMESFEDHVVLRPVRGSGAMRKKKGVWVFTGGTPLKASAVRETIERIRKGREQAGLGKKR
ncbi:MAG: AbrB/MazE/SpoVT family DNA-binding domain-containing protein [Terriglobales bacterium]